MKRYIKLVFCIIPMVIGLNLCLLGTKMPNIHNYRLLKNQPQPADSILMRSFRKTAYKKWELDNILIKQDTLKMLSFSDFLYYPFGKHPNLKAFSAHNTFWGKPKLKMRLKEPGMSVHVFSHLNSSLQVLNNPDTNLIEIVSAKVSDKDIVFVKPISVGMSEVDFLKLFFETVKQDVANNIKVVKIESGILGIWNNYFFNGGRLERVTFDSDYVIK